MQGGALNGCSAGHPPSYFCGISANPPLRLVCVYGRRNRAHDEPVSSLSPSSGSYLSSSSPVNSRRPGELLHLERVSFSLPGCIQDLENPVTSKKKEMMMMVKMMKGGEGEEEEEGEGGGEEKRNKRASTSGNKELHDVKSGPV
jgi:hypothetical protein